MADASGSHMQHHSNFKPHVSTNVSHWLFVGGMCIMIMCLIWINISMFPKLRAYFANIKHDQRNGHQTVILSAVSIVALTVAAIFSCISTVMVLIYSDFHHTMVINDILIKSSLGLYSGCQTLMIYVFTIRVDAVFRDSSVGYPKYVLKCLYISCFVFGALYIFFMITLIFELWAVYYVVALIWIVIYFSLSLMLCTLFVRKVETLMVNASTIDADLLHVILKSGILVPLSICSSFVFFLVMICIIYVIPLSPGQWLPAGIFWIVMDCTVSSVCLFLLFASSNGYYNKYCSCIHQLCEKRKISGIEKKMVQREASSKRDGSRTRTKSRTRTHTQTNPADTVSSQAPTMATLPTVCSLEQVVSDSVMVIGPTPRATPTSDPLNEPLSETEINL